MARYVRTPAGEKRYGLPIGSLIGSGKGTPGRGRLSKAVGKAAHAAESATPDEPKPKRGRLVRTEAGAKRYGVAIGQPIPTKADKAKKTAEKAPEKPAPARGKLASKKAAGKTPAPKTGGSEQSRGKLSSPKKTTPSKADGSKAETKKSTTPPKPPATPPPPPLPPTPAEIQQGIKDAVARVLDSYGSKQGEWVMLADLRDQLPASWSRQEVDRALIQLSRAGEAWIVPENNPKTLTQKQRDAVLIIGNQKRYVLKLT